MTYDPIDTSATDNTADGSVTTQNIDVSQNVNGADTSAAGSGEALTSDGTGGLAFATVGGGIPPNFTYQDVTSQRGFNTTFNNNTGKALFVSVAADEGGNLNFKRIEAVVNNTVVAQKQHQLSSGEFDRFHRIEINFFVPDGRTYRVIEGGLGSIDQWVEAEM